MNDDLTSQERVELRVIAAELRTGLKKDDSKKILKAAQRFILIEEKFGFTDEAVKTPLASVADAVWEDFADPQDNAKDFLDWVRDLAYKLLEVIGKRLQGFKRAMVPLMMASAIFSQNPDGTLETAKVVIQEMKASAGAPMEEQIQSMKRIFIRMKAFAKENRELNKKTPDQELEALRRENQKLKEQILEMAM